MGGILELRRRGQALAGSNVFGRVEACKAEARRAEESLGDKLLILGAGFVCYKFWVLSLSMNLGSWTLMAVVMNFSNE